MSTQPTPTPTIADAISAVNQASSAYQTTATQVATDQSTVAADLTQLNAAEAVVTQDETGETAAVAAYVAALQNLVAVANAQIAALTPTPASGS
jgi:hypothetical protein